MDARAGIDLMGVDLPHWVVTHDFDLTARAEWGHGFGSVHQEVAAVHPLGVILRGELARVTRIYVGQPQNTRCPRCSSAAATDFSAASASLRVEKGPMPFIRS